jgi:hypothetical protein
MDEKQASFTKGLVVGVVAAAVLAAVLVAAGVLGIGGKTGDHDPIIVLPPPNLKEKEPAEIKVDLSGPAKELQNVLLNVYRPDGQVDRENDYQVTGPRQIAFTYTPEVPGWHVFECRNEDTGVARSASANAVSDSAE